MRFRNWLLTGTSITLLALAPVSVAKAQNATDPALVAAYQAFRADQSDANRQALTEACISAGFQSLDDCIAALSGVAPVDSAPPPAEEPAPPAEQPAPPPAEEPPPAETPAPPPEQPAPPPVEEPAPPVEEPAPPVEEPAPPAPSEEPAPAPEQPAPPPAAEQPASEQPAPEEAAPSSEQPAPPSAETPDVLAQLTAAVDLYNEGVAELDAGNAAGQAKVDQAKGQIDAICSAAGFTDTTSCLAQFGLELSPLPPAAETSAPAEEPAVTPEEPVSEEPVSEAPSTEAPAAEEPASEEPIADMPNADEPVTPEATEPLPETVQPDEAAPILDSEKDETAPPSDDALSGDQPAAPEETVAPPPSDEAAQDELQAPPAEEQSATAEEGEPVADGSFDFGFATPDDVPPPATPENEQPDQKVEVVQKPSKDNPNFIFKIGINIYITNVESQRDRYYDRARDEIYYEDLSRGRIRETIVRPDGTKIVTVYNRYGEVLKRTKITPDDREFYLFTYDPRQDRDDDEFFLDVGRELPPLRLDIPARDYILDAGTADEDEVELFLSQPPVEKVRRIYSIDEVKRSARLRDSVRRLEVGNLTFDTGKATISRNQVGTLSNVAKAMLTLLDRNPAEIFLIEGHTDAVGSDVSNLVLSDQRAATIARILTDFYDIPPENLVTQGYGERYLKVKTEAAEPLNRRVTIKRITPLVTYQTASN